MRNTHDRLRVIAMSAMYEEVVERLSKPESGEKCLPAQSIEFGHCALNAFDSHIAKGHGA